MTKVTELEGVPLDLWVARAMGWKDGRWLDASAVRPISIFDWSPSTDWAQGGPIIDREEIGFGVPTQGCNEYQAFVIRDRIPTIAYGSTHLIAAMRLVVKLKYGDEVINEKE